MSTIGTMTAREALGQYLHLQLDTLLDSRRRAIRAETDAAHRMRVTIRRFRKTFGNYRPLLQSAATAEMRKPLAWLSDELGTVRELEMIRIRLEGDLHGLDVGAVPIWFTDLRVEEESASERLSSILEGEDVSLIVGGLTALVTQYESRVDDSMGAELIPRVVIRAVGRVAKRCEEAGRPCRQMERRHVLHRARKATTRARYAAEVAIPMMGEVASETATYLHHVQDALGGYRDSQLALSRLEGVRQRNYSERDEVLTRVVAAEKSAARDALHQLHALNTEAPACLLALISGPVLEG